MTYKSNTKTKLSYINISNIHIKQNVFVNHRCPTRQKISKVLVIFWSCTGTPGVTQCKWSTSNIKMNLESKLGSCIAIRIWNIANNVSGTVAEAIQILNNPDFSD